jgi:hypothetical protein
MRKITALLASVLVGTTGAFAQESPETVKLTMSVSQPSLFDPKKRDVFKGSVDDRSGTTTFAVECSAGASAFFGMSRVDETCAITGTGSIKNPNNPSQSIQRIAYNGGFTIEGANDGYTDAAAIKANYLRVGSAAAESATFGGNLVMMPENPSASAKALGDQLLKSLQEKAAGSQAVEFDTAIDSIRFEGLTVPHVGQRDSKSCSWTGDAIYAYANSAWQMALTVKCGDVVVKLEGNMPLVEAAAGEEYSDAYALNLVVPGENGGDPFGEADPFASVPGITGTIKHVGSGRKTDDGVYEKVAVTGELVGTGVPLEAVRSFGQIFLILARTFEGA